MGKGRGWHGELRRHSEAAKKGRQKLLLDRPAGEVYRVLTKDLPRAYCPHDNIRLIDGVWRCGECGLVEAEIAARERAAEYDPGALG